MVEGYDLSLYFCIRGLYVHIVELANTNHQYVTISFEERFCRTIQIFARNIFAVSVLYYSHDFT